VLFKAFSWRAFGIVEIENTGRMSNDGERGRKQLPLYASIHPFAFSLTDNKNINIMSDDDAFRVYKKTHFDNF
jgi:hypothetical protein